MTQIGEAPGAASHSGSAPALPPDRAPALRYSGVGVPSEMSVVSFDEDECLAFLDVPVTSVAMPLAELGSAAVDALIARIEREPAGDVMVRQPMSLVLRHSVSHPPGFPLPANRGTSYTPG
jgi:LacI family transcriptional regulator, galactose operon repressor